MLRAKKEFILSVIEIFSQCVLFGYTAHYMIYLPYEEYQHHAYVNFWIVFDCIVMLTLLIYVYMTQLMIVKSEI